MCSIRNSRRLVLAMVLVGLAAGCQRIVPPPASAPVNDAAIVADVAMERRNFEPSTAYYANGATIAGGTGYVWQVHETIPTGYRRFVESPVATINILSMPVGVLVNSPLERQVIRGETVPPTYTANPPLP